MVTGWKKRLGEEIGRARRQHPEHMTQEKLADAAGVTRNSIGHYERGRRAPDIDELHKIAIALSREYFYIADDVRVEFSANGVGRPQPQPSQMTLDFDANQGVSVRIEPTEQGLVIKKIPA